MGKSLPSPHHLLFSSNIFLILLVSTTKFLRPINSFNSISSRAFTFSPNTPLNNDAPKLILISGCTGTGKSTFGMSVALDQKILKCISTDTVRAVMRSFIGDDISPALHRSSYSRGRVVATSDEDDDGDDPILSWRETCVVLQASVEGLVDDAIARGTSLVVEGVHIVPSNDLIRKWESNGGTAVGCLLTIRDENAHRNLLEKRGEMTGKGERKKLDSFGRVRVIQDEMIRLAEESRWSLIEQKLEPDALEIVNARLWEKDNMDDDDASIMKDKSADESGTKKSTELPFTEEMSESQLLILQLQEEQKGQKENRR